MSVQNSVTHTEQNGFDCYRLFLNEAARGVVMILKHPLRHIHIVAVVDVWKQLIPLKLNFIFLDKHLSVVLVIIVVGIEIK